MSGPKFLGHVNINVRDVEKSHKWYTELLGLHTYDYMPGRAAFLSADRELSHEVALTQVEEGAPGLQQGQVGLGHFAWKVETLDDLKEFYHKLKDWGIEISPSDHGVSLGLYFRDPDGNGVEVYYEQPRSEWYTQENLFGNENRPKDNFPGPWDELAAD